MKKNVLLALVPCLLFMGCYTAGPATQTGTFLGATIGGVTGAIIGHQFNDPLAGAAIGAGVGALTGGAIGNAHDAAAYQGHTVRSSYYVRQEPVSPQHGRWVIVPGQWVNGRWEPAHKVWVR